MKKILSLVLVALIFSAASASALVYTVAKDGTTSGVFSNLSTAKMSPNITNIHISAPVATNTETIPSTIEVIVHSGGQINVASGKTCTINGPFSAGKYLIANGAGTLILNNAPIQYAAWGTGFADSAITTSNIDSQSVSNSTNLNGHPASYYITTSNIGLQSVSNSTNLNGHPASYYATASAITKYMSPAFTWAANTIFSYAHGLGAAPTDCQLIAKCIDASGDLGYAQNDWAYHLSFYDGITDLASINVRANTTTVYFATGSNVPDVVKQVAAADADVLAMTTSKWQFYLVCKQ